MQVALVLGTTLVVSVEAVVEWVHLSTRGFLDHRQVLGQAGAGSGQVFGLGHMIL